MNNKVVYYLASPSYPSSAEQGEANVAVNNVPKTTGNAVQDLFLEALREELDVPGLLPMAVGYDGSDIHVPTRNGETLIRIKASSSDQTEGEPIEFDVAISAPWSFMVLPVLLKTARRLQGAGVPVGPLSPKFF